MNSSPMKYGMSIVALALCLPASAQDMPTSNRPTLGYLAIADDLSTYGMEPSLLPSLQPRLALTNLQSIRAAPPVRSPRGIAPVSPDDQGIAHVHIGSLEASSQAPQAQSLLVSLGYDVRPSELAEEQSVGTISWHVVTPFGAEQSPEEALYFLRHSGFETAALCGADHLAEGHSVDDGHGH